MRPPVLEGAGGERHGVPAVLVQVLPRGARGVSAHSGTFFTFRTFLGFLGFSFFRFVNIFLPEISREIQIY